MNEPLKLLLLDVMNNILHKLPLPCTIEYQLNGSMYQSIVIYKFVCSSDERVHVENHNHYHDYVKPF